MEINIVVVSKHPTVAQQNVLSQAGEHSVPRLADIGFNHHAKACLFTKANT